LAKSDRLVLPTGTVVIGVKLIYGIGDKLSARMIKWQEEMEKLKDHRASWSAKRKFLEETLIRHDYTTKFLDWIKNDNDPEESMAALTDRITSEGRHGSAAKWFLGNEAFSSWSKGFTDRALGKTHMNIGPKRVLWVSGTYGTGKTTIVLVAFLSTVIPLIPPQLSRRVGAATVGGLSTSTH
jgi:hypothetical protein